MAREQRLTATVTGTVQGVGFRYRTREKALALDLVGEAANLPDGSVRVIAQGDVDRLGELLDWLRSARAPGRVASVDAMWAPATGRFTGFGMA